LVCFRDDDVLLIRRGRSPREGEWSLPGGRIEPGETIRQAALRELLEETGIVAELLGLVDVVDAIFPEADQHYVLIDFLAIWRRGEPRAGDDAAAAVFMTFDEALASVDWDETRRILLAARAMKASLQGE
jgi:8-oxo-dGTP diphosphatase